MASVVESAEWKALQEHFKVSSDMHMRKLFETDPDRFRNFRYMSALSDSVSGVPVLYCMNEHCFVMIVFHCL